MSGNDYSIPIKVDPIRIMIDSNIPGKDPFELKRSMIFHPTLKASPYKKMGDYPLITKDRSYKPEISGYLNTQPYDKKISFFFSKEKQLKVFQDLNMFTPGKIPTTDAIKDKEGDDIKEKNEKILIEIKKKDDKNK